MEGDNENPKKKKKERLVLDKVENAIACIDDANHVDQVILALYSLAACLFPLQPNSLSGPQFFFFHIS